MVFGRKCGNWVQGEFEVTSTHVLDVSDGMHTVQVTGSLCTASTHGAVVRTIRTLRADQQPPQIGVRVPARWLPDKPSKHQIDWGDGHRTWAAAMATHERDRRAAAIGIDPSTLDPDAAIPNGMARRDAAVYWTTNNAPMPDGTEPVQVDEAEHLKRHGEPAEATVVAIDYLRLWPGSVSSRSASIANVAVQVTRSNATSYRAIARFGFRTPERRKQIGYVGAVVPIRINPAQPHRLTIDTNRLPPLQQA